MHTEFESQTQQQIWHTVQRLNKEWLNNKTEELAYYFHKDMVITGADLHELSHNRDESINSYKDFMSKATVREFKECDPEVSVFAFTAIVRYKFDITYEMDEKTHKDTGRDLFVLIKEDERWQAVWRTMIPISEN